MVKLVYKNARNYLGVFTPEGDVNIYGEIEYSDKDFTEYSDGELLDLRDKYDYTYSLDAKAFRLEIAERRLAKWQREN